MSRLFFSLIVIISTIFLGCNKHKDCSCNNSPIAADKYIYPVKPGSAEWNAAGTWGIGHPDPLDSIYKLCQIPNPILQSMSTIGLIQSLEDNPCLINMLLRNNWFQGRNKVLPRLNVSWALNKRTDAGIGIVNFYETKDPNCSACLNTDDEKGRFANNWYLFDMICTQDSILNQLDKATKKRFSKIIIDKLKIQANYPNTFGTLKTPAILILSQIMILENFTPYFNALQANQNLSIFASTGIILADFHEVYDKVLGFSNQFINS
jgi:hypothetical protein